MVGLDALECGVFGLPIDLQATNHTTRLSPQIQSTRVKSNNHRLSVLLN